MDIIGDIAVSVGAAFIVGMPVWVLRKPRQYQKLYPILMLLAGLASLLASIYYSGSLATSVDEASAIIEKLRVIVPATFFAFAYLSAIYFLPAYLGLSGDGTDNDDKEQKD